VFAHHQIVLVDTNVIIEAHRTRCFAQLANYFALHTVEKIVEETQTGHQNRRPEENIDYAALRSRLKHVETVTDVQRAAFAIAHPNVALDPGERDLIIYAESFDAKNVWLLNSPDMAAVRYSYQRGWIDRLVSLETMNAHIKARPAETFRDNYTERWLSQKRIGLLLQKA
jgi:hypothetical protein